MVCAAHGSLCSRAWQVGLISASFWSLHPKTTASQSYLQSWYCLPMRVLSSRPPASRHCVARDGQQGLHCSALTSPLSAPRWSPQSGTAWWSAVLPGQQVPPGEETRRRSKGRRFWNRWPDSGLIPQIHPHAFYHQPLQRLHLTQESKWTVFAKAEVPYYRYRHRRHLNQSNQTLAKLRKRTGPQWYHPALLSCNQTDSATELST